MGESHLTPVSITSLLLLWLSSLGQCQFDPYGGPPYYGDPQSFPQYFPPEGVPSPQAWPQQQQQQQQQLYPPVNANNANLVNPFLLANNQGQTTTQQQQQQNQQQLLQQLQGSYPNLPSLPFQTVTPNNPYQTQGAANRYPFNQNNNNFGNLGNGNNNQPRADKYPFNPNNNLGNIGNPNNNNNNQRIDKYPFNPTQQQSVGNAFPYPNFPNLPFQTISPTQFPPIDRVYNPNIFNNKPKIPLPRIRVIEFPSSEYFEYGGGKLVQPKRPNADLYVGGSDADVPITSRIFVECTGPNQVEWVRNGTSQRRPLSVVTKNIQITIPEERVPAPGSGEYTYLRLGLEEQIAERDSGVYICRDRILPQNYISIRVLIAKPIKGRPNYPFDPKDPNTIHYSRSDSTVTLPCKIEDAQATINLHKNEGGKLSCPYTMDGRVVYDRYKGFIMQTRAFQDLEGRYVCVGDFNGELRLMKYRLVASEAHFTTRYVGGDAQNIIALDGEKKPSDHTSASSALLAKVDSFPKSVFSGLTIANLTGSGLVDPRSEFDIATAESFAPVPPTNSKTSPSFGSTNDQNSLKL